MNNFEYKQCLSSFKKVNEEKLKNCMLKWLICCVPYSVISHDFER